jgi:hypothetical protein
MVKKVLAPVIILLIMALPGGCGESLPAVENNQTPAAVTGDTVTVVVTRDFGKELVLEQDIEIEADTSAMAALQMVADVETKYGGGYVESISGINSASREADKNKDWFFYVNGIASNLGARDYVLQDGDVEHWDFRDWSYQQFVPAVIGDFPQPFLNGCLYKGQPTLVVYEPAFSTEAGALAEMIQEYGVNEISTVQSDRLSDEARQDGNLIIIAGRENPLISELNQTYKKLGFFAYFEGGGLTVLDAEGNISDTPGGGTGLIQATQNPWNPRGVGSGENVVWVVTGCDDAGVRSAVTTLLENQVSLRHAFAAVVAKGQVVKIP